MPFVIRRPTVLCAWAAARRRLLAHWLEDEGGGVAEEDLERIFAPFSRLDGSRPGDGGLGWG
jgi:K+-sensing histidine kinase KdpD